MLTNDERREVAAEMRARGHELYSVNLINVGEQAGLDMDEFDDYDDAREAVWNRLADLIEPEPERTCHVVSTIRYDYEGGYAGTEYVTNLSCGHKHTDRYGDTPNFCSECGERVKEGE